MPGATLAYSSCETLEKPPTEIGEVRLPLQQKESKPGWSQQNEAAGCRSMKINFVSRESLSFGEMCCTAKDDSLGTVPVVAPVPGKVSAL